MLVVYGIQILAINRHRSLNDSWRSIGLLLPLYWLLLLAKYWKRRYDNLRFSTGLVLDVNRMQILANSRHRNLNDIWRSSGLLLVQYWLLLLEKFRQRRYANLWNCTGLVLAVYRIQILAINRHWNFIDSKIPTYYFSFSVPYIFQFFRKRTIFFSTKYEISMIFFDWNCINLLLNSIVKLNDQSSF